MTFKITLYYEQGRKRPLYTQERKKERREREREGEREVKGIERE